MKGTKKLLIPEVKDVSSIPGFKIQIPVSADYNPVHFPTGFIPDYPASVTNSYIRELIGLSEKTDGPFHVFIDLPEFIDNDYPWIPFTLALHSLILREDCNVVFRGENIFRYSELIDSARPSKPLHCMQNFMTYLCTKGGNRAERVFNQKTTREVVPFGYVMPSDENFRIGFTPYYAHWLMYPYRFTGPNGRVYASHPFDHLPIKNLTGELRTDYLTKKQWEAKKRSVPSMDKAVFLHDQAGTVTLRPYWPESETI